ncbi:hypothetical protein AT728_40150 [Streptomyces silvensis]|uniref:Uncharacterized protein n=1 Tax=Streptomyces silvensis TaxID=1765722 RepID=A0A0W7XCB3_9ACTN|nr:hypothetical protein AT728_40150 [Streptomyces silvensis]
MVLDTAPRLTSPWPAWPDVPGAGLVSLPPDRPCTRTQVHAAVSPFPGPGGNWGVLTDHRPWSETPLDLPAAPGAWYQLAAAGGWQIVVGDTAHPIAHDIVTSRVQGRAGLTSGWCALPFAVPVLCAPATGPGVNALQTAVKALTAEGLPLQRTVVALTSMGAGRLPPPVRAAATMLQSQVFAVVNLPFDPHIRSHGLTDAARLSRRTSEATATLVADIVRAAQHTWGEPLPPAPVPAGLQAPGPPVSTRPVEGVLR